MQQKINSCLNLIADRFAFKVFKNLGIQTGVKKITIVMSPVCGFIAMYYNPEKVTSK